MKIHVSSVHERNKPFKCEICDQTFSEKGSMNRHVARVHGEKKTFERRIAK